MCLCTRFLESISRCNASLHLSRLADPPLKINMGRPKFYYKKKGKKLDGTAANSSKAGSLSDKRATSTSASVTVDTDQDAEVQEQPTKKVKWGKQVEEGDNGESDIDEVEEGEENGKVCSLASQCSRLKRWA